MDGLNEIYRVKMRPQRGPQKNTGHNSYFRLIMLAQLGLCSRVVFGRSLEQRIEIVRLNRAFGWGVGTHDFFAPKLGNTWTDLWHNSTERLWHAGNCQSR